MEKLERLTRRPWLCSGVVGIIAVLLGLLVFREFAFGDNRLLYKDIGGDSLNVFYPNYILRSDYLRQHGLLSWSFEVGMGQNLFPYIGAYLITPVIWVSRELIASALVYQHLLYIFVTALCAARFFLARGMRVLSALLGALCLSFSAYMCMGSCWFFHAVELTCFTVLLLAAERAIVAGQWWAVTLGVLLVATLGAFHLYLTALLLALYIPARLFEFSSLSFRPLLKRTSILAGAALLGAMLSAVVSIGGFYAVLNSPRGSGPTSWVPRLTSASPFGLESALHYVTAATRMFSNDLLGTGSSFHGWKNYLEAPMSYAGLVVLLLFPQSFVGASRRQRIIATAVLCFVVLPTTFPWLRHLFWGFQGDYYRAYSLFVLFGMLTLAVTAFDRYVTANRLNVWVLLATVVVALGILFWPQSFLQELINKSLRNWVAILLVAYAVLLVAGHFLRHQGLAAVCIVLVTLGELYYFDRITVLDDRPVLTKTEMGERTGYNDETVDAVRDLKASDHDFYRLTKTFLSSPGIFSSVNDAMVFGFYGTSSYSSFNNLNYTRFLIALDVVDPEIIRTDTQWSLGLIGRPVLSTFAGEKYVLADDPVVYQTAEGYELLKMYGSRYLFRNQFNLPLGLVYEESVNETDFAQLWTEAKASALLEVVVLPDKEAAASDLLKLSLTDLKDRARSFNIQDAAEYRRELALQVSEFSESKIAGRVRLDRPGILVVQTTFDLGWRAQVDGKAAPVHKVDIGLVGVSLGRGPHEVMLYYVPAFLGVGAFLSALGLVIFGFLLYRWPRLSDLTQPFLT